MDGVRSMLSNITPQAGRFKTPLIPTRTSPATDLLGDEVYINIIDELRELGVADLVSLPQLVVVGDQSSGKSSVLESLTDFAFPRAPGLCTRYVTQITCRRDDTEKVEISIIPGFSSSHSRAAELQEFKRTLEVDDLDLAEVFEEANYVMGIRMDENDKSDPNLTTFSEDILKVEISGPDRQHLTVIDVPGIFRNSKGSITTEHDIQLVNYMVKKYIKDPRTIILAVVTCNQDIATQEILNLAETVDPEGQRTLGVLTKPDLAPEHAMKRKVCDLVKGRQHCLRLGYYVVKNRGSDDDDEMSLHNRQKAEAAFFSSEPWADLKTTGRVGTPALLSALSRLLRSVTKREFKGVTSEVAKLLHTTREESEALGPERSDPTSQRRFLGNMGTKFQEVASCALAAQYGKDIFKGRSQMRLVTLICELNETFGALFRQQGHLMAFKGESVPPLKLKDSRKWKFDELSDLNEILREINYESPMPAQDRLMDRIAEVFKSYRGPELGTFNPAILRALFEEQTTHWDCLIRRHTSRAIVLVHHFIVTALREMCPDEDIRGRIWNRLLREKVLNAYQRAMEHAMFLAHVECRSTLITVNPAFNEDQKECRSQRLTDNSEGADGPSPFGEFAKLTVQSQRAPKSASKAQSEVFEDIHDTLKSYYSIASTRVVDSVCHQVVFHYLLDGKKGPLGVFNADLIMGLEDEVLQDIASEDYLVGEQHDRLKREIKKLQKAVECLRVAM